MEPGNVVRVLGHVYANGEPVQDDEILTRVEVEMRICRLTDALEERTEDYQRLAQAAAEAEAKYRAHHAMCTLAIINGSHDQNGRSKMTVDERAARADAAANDEYRTFLIATAARNSCRESLLSLRANLDALRTLAASIRALS
jgi:hypothetical protein